MLQGELEESFRRAEVKGGIESGIKRLQVIHKADGSQPALRLAKEFREQVDRLPVAANDDDAAAPPVGSTEQGADQRPRGGHENRRAASGDEECRGELPGLP